MTGAELENVSLCSDPSPLTHKSFVSLLSTPPFSPHPLTLPNPQVFVTRSGTMLAEDDDAEDDHSEDQDGQSLNDIAGDQEDRVKKASPWPFYEVGPISAF